MYAVHLPSPIPAAGSPGGPPEVSARRVFWESPTGDPRAMFQDLVRHPERIPSVVAEMGEQFRKAQEARRKKN
jgi:hypothetical protein